MTGLKLFFEVEPHTWAESAKVVPNGDPLLLAYMYLSLEFYALSIPPAKPDVKVADIASILIPHTPLTIEQKVISSS